MNAWKNRAIRLGRALFCLAVGASAWLAMNGTAQARYVDPDAPGAEGPAVKSYVLPWMLVVLCIAMGMMVVCRGSRRSSESKLSKQDDDD